VLSLKKLISLILLVAAVTSVYLFISFQGLKKPTGMNSGEIIYEVAKGSSFNKVLNDLSVQGYLNNNLIIKLFAKFTKYNVQLKAGTYNLTPSMTQLQVLEELTTGKTIDEKITFSEGLNVNDIGILLESRGFYTKKEFLNVARDKLFVKELLSEDLPNFEGYLFPETYFVNENTTIKSLIKKMVENFKINYKKSLVGAKIKMSRKDHVIMASLIEKETGAEEERTLVSAVYHNRIKKGMRLQCDPTILYGMFDKTGVFPTNIRKKDILEKTRYNTYAMSGMPYGAIANPGLSSLKAALAPRESKMLYFVSRNDGTHVFSETLEKHNTAVRKFQMDPKAREGKSWRDRNK